MSSNSRRYKKLAELQTEAVVREDEVGLPLTKCLVPTCKNHFRSPYGRHTVEGGAVNTGVCSLACELVYEPNAFLRREGIAD